MFTMLNACYAGYVFSAIFLFQYHDQVVKIEPDYIQKCQMQKLST